MTTLLLHPKPSCQSYKKHAWSSAWKHVAPCTLSKFLGKSDFKRQCQGAQWTGQLPTARNFMFIYCILYIFEVSKHAWSLALACVCQSNWLFWLCKHKYGNFIPISWSLFQPPMQNLRKLITKQVYSVFDLDLRLPSNEGVVSMQKKKNVAQIAALILRRCCTGCQLWIKFSNASALKQVFLQNAQKTKKGNWILQSGLLRACAARLENL